MQLKSDINRLCEEQMEGDSSKLSEEEIAATITGLARKDKHKQGEDPHWR